LVRSPVERILPSYFCASPKRQEDRSERQRVVGKFAAAWIGTMSRYVLSDVFGTSGQAMLEALLENKRSATEIAALAHWSGCVSPLRSPPNETPSKPIPGGEL